jgi:hypothetical protein
MVWVINLLTLQKTKFRRIIMADDVIGVQNVGNKVIVENVGAKRIAGINLIAQAKIPNWMFYITDIDSFAVFANQGSDVWIGGFGHPVAGDTTLRLSLLPFEGQKFFDIQDNTAYTYTGGAWNGGAQLGNLPSPTYLRLTAPGTLTRGREHVISYSGDLLLPSKDQAGTGGSKTGHAVTFIVDRARTVILKANGANDRFVSDEGTEETSLTLIAGTLYTAVFNETLGSFPTDRKWVVTYGANKLNASTTIDIGTGLTKSGTLQADTLAIEADFASTEEAEAGTSTEKILNPSHLPVAVNAAIATNPADNYTGLQPKDTETKFLVTTNVDRTKIDYPEFTVVFNADPYLRTTPLEILTIPAGQLTLPNTPGVVVHFMSVNNAGVVALSPTITPSETLDTSHLCTIAALDGEVAIGAFGDIINNGPWLASTHFELRAGGTTASGGVVTASATVGKVKQDSVKFTRESVNWEQSTSNPHVKTVVASDPTQWTYLDRNGVIVGSTIVDEVDGQNLDTGAAVGNNNYSIQVLYMSSEGVIGILLGQSTFSNFTDAQAGVEQYIPVVPSIIANTSEIARWIVKGNQYPGSGSLDLTIGANFTSTKGSGVAGGSVSTTAVDISTSTDSNDLNDTNLQLNLDELANNRTKIAEVNHTDLDNPILHVLKKNKLAATIEGKLKWERLGADGLASYVDRYGILKYSPKQDTTNLALHSEDLTNAIWIKQQATISANVATSPRGIITADKLEEDATAASTHRIRQSVVTVAGDLITISVFAKAGERDWFLLAGTNALKGKFFNLREGTLGTFRFSEPDNSSIVDEGNGWFRCSISFVASTTSEIINIYVAEDDTVDTYNGVAGNGVYIHGCQLEKTKVANGYIKTVGSTVAGTSTVGIDQSREEVEGWLIEGASENLLLRSEELDDAAWTAGNSSVVANTIASPDGAESADRMIENSVNSFHRVQQSITTTNGTLHTFSGFFKKNERTFCFIYESVSGTGRIFNLTTGAIESAVGATPADSSIVPLGNDWFKVSITLTTTSTTPQIWAGSALDGSTASYLGDGSSSVYIWGLQIEELPFATSYIPTLGTSQVRAADRVTVPIEDNFLSSVQGSHTQAYNYKLLGDTGNVQRLYSLRAGADDNLFYNIVNGATDVVTYRDGASTNVNTPSANIGSKHSVALVTDGSNLIGYSDGAASSPLAFSPTQAMSTDADLYIGGALAGDLALYGHVSDFRVYDFAMNETQVKLLNGD